MQKKVIGMIAGIILIIRRYLGKKAKAIAEQPAVKKIIEHPVIKEVQVASMEASKETIERSKKAHREIANLRGAQKIAGYSVLGTIAFIFWGVPGVMTAVIIGKVSMKLLQRQMEKRQQKRKGVMR